MLFFIALLQYAFGVIHYRGDLLVVLGYALLAVLGLAVGRSCRESVFILCVAFVFVSIFSVFFALSQYFEVNGGWWVVDLPVGGRVYANFAQPNTLSTVLLMGFFSALYLLECTKIGRFGAYLFFVLLAFCLALAASRTSWLVLLASAFFMYFWRADFSILRLYDFFFFCLAFLGCLFLFEFFQGVGGLRSWGGAHRLDIWLLSVKAVVSGAWFGHGVGQVGGVQLLCCEGEALGYYFDHAHNIILDILLWCGWLFGGVVIFLVSMFFIRLYLGGGKLFSDKRAVMLLAIPVLVHAMLEFPLEYAFLLFPLSVLVGRLDSSAKLFDFNSVGVFFLGFLGFGYTCFLFSEYLYIEGQFRSARFDSARVGSGAFTMDSERFYFFDQLAALTLSAGDGEISDDLVSRYPLQYVLARYSLQALEQEKMHVVCWARSAVQRLHGDSALESLDAELTAYWVSRFQSASTNPPPSHLWSNCQSK